MNNSVKKVAMAGIFAAITFVVFTYLSIPVPTAGGGKVTIHLGNAFLILGVLLLGTKWGALAGALGLTIGDLLDPVYIVQAPVTFAIKLMVGIIAGLVAHKVFHLMTETNNSRISGAVILASAAGLVFNTFADPLIRYYYKLLVLGKPAAELSLAINFSTTLINSVASMFVIFILYMAVRKPLRAAALI